MKYKVVYSIWSGYHTPPVKEIEKEYERGGEELEGTGIYSVVENEAERIFDDVDYPSDMVFFVHDGTSWNKVFVDVIPVPTFEVTGIMGIKER